MYKTLGFRWLLERFCPASAFATVDRDEARNPQRFIHVTVMGNFKNEHSGQLWADHPSMRIKWSDKNSK